MQRLPDIAIKECLVELRAACRLPIDEPALETVVGWLRPNFERILGNPEGPRRWADHGQRMRDNARHLGGFADFFASHAEVDRIGITELTRAYEMIRADCTVRSERTPVAWEYCNPPKPPGVSRPRKTSSAQWRRRQNRFRECQGKRRTLFLLSLIPCPLFP